MAKTSETFEAKPNSRVSNMVKAMQGWNESLGKVESAAPKGKFGRVVIIESTNAKIDGSQLDVEFTVPFDDDAESNEAEITVYNLSKKTISGLRQNAVITITAGYTGDSGIIFSGRISKVSTKWVGVHKVTTIYAIDSYDLKERDVKSISYSARTKASRILRDLVDLLGLPVAAFSVQRDHTYSDGATVDGGLMAAIKKYAGVCGVSVYINKGKVYVRHISEGDNIGFSVNVDTGLLDSPEEFTEEQNNENYTDTVYGVKLKMLLEHRITTAAVINLESKNYSGKYRVSKGSHVCTENDFYTEITCIERNTSTVNETKTSSGSSSSGSSDKKSGISDILGGLLDKVL